MSDPCWEALSLRGLARCQRAAGDPDEARRLLVAAKDRCARYPDTYQWAVAQVLTELAEVENGADRDHVNDARRVAQRGPMAAVIARLDRLVTNRVLATVLFTDIIGSTTIVAELGDRRWQQVLEQHHALVRRQLVIHAGREVDTAGDGFFAAFDGPAQAIRCAAAIMAAARGLGLEERAGLHTGECEMIDGKVGGIAVHIGARVAAAAGPGEVLVSGTVKDLVAGSGIGFLEQGVVELRGVPGLWPLFRVDPSSL
jgi:class 3 adenylate cyclase